MFDQIKKILGLENKELKEPRELKVNFNEILEFVKQETKDAQIDAKNKTDGLLNEIFSEFENLEQGLRELKKAEPEAQMPIGRKFDFKIRDRFCDNINSAIKRLKRPSDDIESIFNFLCECDSVFKKIDDISPKSSAWLRYLFQEKIKGIGMAVKNIQNQIKELRDFLDSDGMILKIETRIEDITKDIEKIEKELANNEQKLKKNKKEIMVLNEKIDAKKEKLVELKNSKENSFLSNLKNEIKNKKQEASHIEQHISSFFSGTHRIMKKFRYIDAGLDKEFTKHLDSYLNSPAETYVNEKLDENWNIHKILSKINKAIEKKDINVSKREHSKWTELMDLLERGDLIKYKQHYIEIQSKIKECEQEYERKNKPFKNKVEEIEKEIKKIENNLSLLKNQRSELENNRNKFNSELENNKNVLEEVLDGAFTSAAGKVKVEVIY